MNNRNKSKIEPIEFNLDKLQSKKKDKSQHQHSNEHSNEHANKAPIIISQIPRMPSLGNHSNYIPLFCNNKEYHNVGKPVTHQEISVFLSNFNNIDCLLAYNCPEHLELKFNDSVKNAHRAQRIPDYKEPGEIYISTMTTSSNIEVKKNLNLLSLFVMLPCFSTEICDPNESEKVILQIAQKDIGKKRKKKTVSSSVNKPSNNRIAMVTNAFFNSNWIIPSKTSYCPLSIVYQVFKQYTANLNKYLMISNDNEINCDFESWKTHLMSNDFTAFPVQNIHRSLYYPKRQTFFENAAITSTEFYAPKLYDCGTTFVFNCDVRNIFPTFIDNKFKGMLNGDSSISEKKKASDTAFDNQCTMRIANDSLESIINTKCFVNGKIQMTGCKSLENTEKAIRFLIHELEMASYHAKLYREVMKEIRLLQCERGSFTIDIPNEIWEIIFSNLSLMNLLDIMTVSKQFYIVIKSNVFWVKRIESEYKFKIRQTENGDLYAYERFNPRFKTYKKLNKEILIDNCMMFYAQISDERYKKPFIPLRDQIEHVGISKIKTEMINSNFDIYFNIDQAALTNIVKKPPYNLFANFDTHPSVNIKYVTKEYDTDENDHEITILVFRTGKIIITGVKSNRLLQKTYTFINNVIKNHYYELWQPPDENDTKERGPNK